MDLPPQLLLVFVGLVGLVVGSFLNVAIHRLPLPGKSVWSPRRSHCPSCDHEITWSENLPLVSWLLQGGRCRACRWRIPVRYPLVEALNGGLWVLAAYSAPEGAYALVAFQCLVLSGLLVATFVDFDHFEIPDEVSIGGMVLAPIASFLVPELHTATWLARRFSEGTELVDRGGALIGSLAGLAVGGGVLIAIGWIGRRVYGREAMGFGDVKLLAAGGGFVGPGGALAALVLASLAGSIVGLGIMTRYFCLSYGRARRNRAPRAARKALRTARVAGRYIPFGPYLGIGVGIVLLAWNDVLRALEALV
jgi:leader peptidase (prepilin peptidase)/N-methyltransferase